MKLSLKKDCRMCMTTGVAMTVDASGGVVESDPCPACGGNGYTVFGKVDEDNVVFSIDLLSAIDTTEYNSLSDAQKEGVKIILSCGFIDISEGSYAVEKLTSWFGAESTTIANLTALLT